MTFSYDPTIGRTTDQVRFWVGDTDEDDPQLQDEEIAYVLAADVDPLRAAITCAESIAARFARQVDTAVGDVRRSLSQASKNYYQLADTLRMKVARTGVVPFAGGQSIVGKEVSEENLDVVQPYFYRGMQSSPLTDPQTDEPDEGFGPVLP